MRRGPGLRRPRFQAQLLFYDVGARQPRDGRLESNPGSPSFSTACKTKCYHQVRLAFGQAGCRGGAGAGRWSVLDALGRDLRLDRRGELTPILLAVSDNGAQDDRGEHLQFIAMVAIAQHLGRRTPEPTRAWIEWLNGTVKHEWPHLTRITDPCWRPSRLSTTPTRLHSSIRYIIPADDHEGRGETIPKLLASG